ncbi:MAG TPA: ABC transporter ATP-binding protein [Mobilitalea sp.]|nr:ABC transporter ATP-binding protein [Mobilitalea sp.]
MSTFLEINDLEVSFYSELGETKAVKNASFHIEEGEIFGIVGESGSGKSVAMKSILKLLPANSKIKSSTVLFEGKDILKLKEKQLRSIRGKDISIVFQDSLTALNPVYTIGSKLIEFIMRNHKMTKAEAKLRAVELLSAVGITDPEKHLKSYPHELSGGMRQRVMIAMSISSNPKLMIADEPTTALDVTIQAQILHLLRSLQREYGMSIILITHDLGVVAQICSRIAVMCGGYVVEEGTTEDIFYHPLHPYTQALIASMPKPGSETFVPFLERPVSDEAGSLCPFLSRCRYANSHCEECLPEFYQDNAKHFIRCHRKGGPL